MFLHGCLIQQASQRKGHHHRPQYKPHFIETRTTAPNRNKNNRIESKQEQPDTSRQEQPHHNRTTSEQEYIRIASKQE
jgi:hypothetical protein